MGPRDAAAVVIPSINRSIICDTGLDTAPCDSKENKWVEGKEGGRKASSQNLRLQEDYRSLRVWHCRGALGSSPEEGRLRLSFSEDLWPSEVELERKVGEDKVGGKTKEGTMSLCRIYGHEDQMVAWHKKFLHIWRRSLGSSRTTLQ